MKDYFLEKLEGVSDLLHNVEEEIAANIERLDKSEYQYFLGKYDTYKIINTIFDALVISYRNYINNTEEETKPVVNTKAN